MSFLTNHRVRVHGIDSHSQWTRDNPVGVSIYIFMATEISYLVSNRLPFAVLELT